MLSPCGRPLPSLKNLDFFLLSRQMQASRSLPKSFSHLVISGPKLKNLYTLSRNKWDTVSKALAKSMAITAPLMLFFLAKIYLFPYINQYLLRIPTAVVPLLGPRPNSINNFVEAAVDGPRKNFIEIR
jgi:hypothetical protein